jgi:hypothetical protein
VSQLVFEQIAGGDQTYRDAHAWQFTPASFELLILDLSQTGACDWHVDWLKPQAAVEFLGRLRPGALSFSSNAALQQRRKELLIQLAVETAEQLETILVPEKKSQEED